MSRKLIFGLLLLAIGATAHAGSFRISPVRVHMHTGQSSAVLRIKNNTDSAAVFQLSGFSWSQKSGKPVLTPTRELLATPPIFKLSGGAEQIVRVGLRAPRDARREHTYRLMVTQVPSKQKSGFTGLTINLRFSIPVFIAPAKGNAEPRLKWHLHKLENDKIKLSVVNNGTAHARLSSLSLGNSAHGPSRIKVPLGHPYVLAGTHRSWILELKQQAGARKGLILRGEAGDEPFHLSLVGQP